MGKKDDYKIKKCADLSLRTKTQIPVVAKQTLCEMGLTHLHKWNLHFIKSDSVSVAKKECIYSYKKENNPENSHIQFVWQKQFSTF